MYRCELRITEDAEGRQVTVLAPSEPEDLPVSAQALAHQHLLAELQSRRAVGGQMPHRVEVRVWEDLAFGEPAAAIAWEITHGIVPPAATR